MFTNNWNRLSASSDSEDDNEIYHKNAVLPVASTGMKEFDPNAWSNCSAQEFLRNVILEAENYPTIILSNLNPDDIKDNNGEQKVEEKKINISKRKSAKSISNFSVQNEKFIKCPEGYKLTDNDKESIIKDYKKIRNNLEVCEQHPKYSEEKLKTICDKSRSLPDGKSLKELSQQQIIRILRIQYQTLVEKLLNDEAFSELNLYWIWTGLHLLDSNQTNDTYSLLRDISRSLSQRRCDIIESIHDQRVSHRQIDSVAKINVIVFIISNIFFQFDLSD